MENVRTIIIGDVHGCIDELHDLLDEVKITSNDRIVFVGDLINRGPNSQLVLRLARMRKAICVLGNHELRLLRYREQRDRKQLKSEDYDTLRQFTKADWHYLESMRRYYYMREYHTVVVHGGFVPGRRWYSQPVDVVTQIQVLDKNGQPARRKDAPDGHCWAKVWQGPPFVVYGHQPRLRVYPTNWTLGIDTGCAYGNKLTAYILPERRILQVPARRTYYKKTLTQS